MSICTIFAGGKISGTDFINSREIREKSGLIICADSGLHIAEKVGITPDLIVGDFDSYTGTLPENVEIHRSVPEKDDTDTLMAVRIAIDRGCDEIRLYGGLGARFDHSFANIQTLIFACEKGCKMTIYDADNVLTVRGAGEYEFPCKNDWYFSIFSLTEKAEIGKLQGVKYPLENYEMCIAYPIGVSNEITADKAYLQINSGLVLVIESKK
ncbi:MAG: thiamine diphosphokinase [Ruminococcus sp.]|nr:thiamine diphosphokinase [Ruminococcus sp.]